MGEVRGKVTLDYQPTGSPSPKTRVMGPGLLGTPCTDDKLKLREAERPVLCH